MTETLFPKRQRCKKCSKKLATTVLNGLFCSYSCAEESEPFKNVDEAPRWCKTEKDGKWVWKKRFRAINELPLALRNDPSSSTYWCSHCCHLHVGHSRMDMTEKTRVIRSKEQLAEVLVKARGNATHREIARRSNVQAIRIKELEDPKSAKVELKALFDLLSFYKLKLSLVFK